MGYNKNENTKKQGKCENNPATPNNGKNQATETTVNVEAWPPLTSQKPVGYFEEVLEKLSSLDAKMSSFETQPKQMSDLASTLKTVFSDVELLHKEIKRLREENCSRRVECTNTAQLSAGLDQIAVHLIRRWLILSADHSSHAPMIFVHESVDPMLNPSNENFAEQWSTFLDDLWVKIQLSHCLECQILHDHRCQCRN